MGRECYIGFADLYRLAKKCEWSPAQEKELLDASQEARNAWVKQLAQEAGCVRVEDRLGSDARTYTAFWVEGPPWFEALVTRWSPPVPLARVATVEIPSRPGCYVLTDDEQPFLIPGRVRRVGSASDLREGLNAHSVENPATFVRWICDDSQEDLAAALRTFLVSPCDGGRTP